MKIELKIVSTNKQTNEVELQLAVTGEKADAESAVICVQAPKYSEPFSCIEICVADIKKNEIQTTNLTYKLLTGGRFVFYAWNKRNQLESLRTIVVMVEGAGMYSGNTHSHSVYSDGKSTLEENREAMMACGHSFIYATDHNTTNHFDELYAYEERGKQENFLHIPGWEYTTKNGHAIAYRSTATVPTENIYERNNVEIWQKFVDETTEKNAIVYLAHPFEAPRYEFGDNVLCGIKGITGVEAWNGYNYHALTYQNRKNFEVWDALNRRGDRHYYGNAVSDAHTKKGQSSPYIKGYLKTFSKDAVENLLQTGTYIGSNGPEIEFSIGEAGIGTSCLVDSVADSARKLMKLDIFDPLGDIQEIRVYKGLVDREYTVKPNTHAVFEFYPTGENDKRNYTKNIYLDVTPGEFYRAEVVTGVGVTAYTADRDKVEKGFAFTNPIWIEK